MKIVEESSEELCRFDAAKVEKGKATDLFKLQKYDEAGERFCQAAKMLEGKKRLGGEDEEVRRESATCWESVGASGRACASGERSRYKEGSFSFDRGEAASMWWGWV